MVVVVVVVVRNLESDRSACSTLTVGNGVMLRERGFRYGARSHGPGLRIGERNGFRACVTFVARHSALDRGVRGYERCNRAVFFVANLEQKETFDSFLSLPIRAVVFGDTRCEFPASVLIGPEVRTCVQYAAAQLHGRLNCRRWPRRVQNVPRLSCNGDQAVAAQYHQRDEERFTQDPAPSPQPSAYTAPYASERIFRYQ